MRKIIAATFVSLDGVMQAPGGPEEDPVGGFKFGGWTFHYFDEVAGSAMEDLFSKPFALLLGRRTYDIFAAYWPYQKDPIADAFNRATKYVATHRPDTLAWRSTHALGPDIIATLRRLSQEDGPDLLIQGSGNLIQTLLANGLIDEIRLMTFPLLLGKGKRLFGDAAMPAAFKLVKSQASTTGVIMATYERAGEIEVGSFVTGEPSDAELERRKNWK
ncbi:MULTISPECIES: dihydrofolate reductase family protein [unclassified Mesorhizobium]|uniref:dihydrofolate reductase family protein n=1 Tax=unclassified Mesorhizobium TaxID=325217 RepID=UPI000FD70B46|nr:MULTISPECIES: dihydrofolate reductase family protein [unclassified Mesorhizobium]TGR47582.1 dihydrofolate reductase [bacterium M00.F.Ca.ET.199.01.1.1]TGU36995.1 dihydrofolate reductase [bacterium M00.F.Ca.ET.156.01.1.1]TGV88186.1 dihydrofolate reductase [Mesorhizobium sp. M00.F.Ca.ET.149.01.1.1]TGR29254.1 dihydrofolate reductase [Mesorhizobium sp. M8A.F.Ca.ET.202.01.1.1]TGR29517.1 dihydrofolate reductase [Mesorhizobium sp. M8A.F.Ca.ET.197.01.1.1]